MSTANAASRLAAVEARLSVFEQRLPADVEPLSEGWAVVHIIQTAEEEWYEVQDMGEVQSIRCCSFSPDSSLICVALGDSTLKFFDVTSGNHRFTLEGHEDAVTCCKFSRDGATIVSASDDDTVKLWDPTSGAVIRTLSGHTHLVLCCDISHDGRFI